MACNPYTYPSNCPYPNYGNPNTINYTSAPHTSLLQTIFGTSTLDIVINSIVIIAILYLLYRYLYTPLKLFIASIANFQSKAKSDDYVFLEITPPISLDRKQLANQEFVTTVQDVLSRYDVLSLELIGSFHEGIRFVIRVRSRDVKVLQKHLSSHISGIKFKQVNKAFDPDLAGNAESHWLLELKQAGHYALPLKVQENYSQHDIADYLIGAMTKLEPNEVVILQLIIRPHYSLWTNRLRNKLEREVAVSFNPGIQGFILARWWIFAIGVIYGLITHDLRACISLIVLLLLVEPFIPIKAKDISPAHQKLQDRALYKLNQPLFDVNIRLAVISDNQANINSLSKGLLTAFAALGDNNQKIIAQPANSVSFLETYLARFRGYKFSHRLPSLLSLNSCVLSSSELADIYHLPYGNTVTEDFVRSEFVSLPTPLSMKRHANKQDYDVVLGVNQHQGTDTAIGLTNKEREKHVYIVGTTGSGKTTLMEYALVQDIKAGKGVAFIDPHGDAAKRLLAYIPKSRIRDVVYLNPIDIKYPIAINLLELPEGLDEDELVIEKERVTEAVISVLRKVFADDESNAHRIESLLRNAIQTAFYVEGATLFTILKIIRNTDYRKKVLTSVDDQYLLDFWREEYGKAGGMQKVSMSKGLTSRIDRFRSSAPASRMLDQPKSTISFEDIIDSGKILICNFSTDMGEDTSALFGTTVLAKLKIAAERRARQSEDERKPFYVYVDEFQNFATTPFVKMLSASRKYKLFLTIAEQTTNQQEEERLTEAILANVSTVIAFSLGSNKDEQVLLPRFRPYISEGALSNLPSYNFYMRVKAQETIPPVSAETLILDKAESSKQRAEEVVAESRMLYGVVHTQSRPNGKKSVTKKQTSGDNTSPEQLSVIEPINT